MTVNKADNASIFKASDGAKQVVEEYLKKDEYADI